MEGVCDEKLSQTPLGYNGIMIGKNNQKPSEFAHLILDKPLVSLRIDIEIEAGQSCSDVLNEFITKPGVAFVVLVNGVVVDKNQIIQPGDEIRCVPQIIGG
jgi:sulfur carrier protein ThiS